MKLRKTVEMSIEEAQDDFCYRYETCGVCPLNKKAPLDCLAWCVAHPREAAHLMGYEVVEDGQYICPSCGNALPENPIGGYTCPYCGYGERTEKKEVSMDKPLKDWTLGEVKECCSKHGTCVSECPFSTKNKLCRMTSNPCDWDLTDKPRWTEQEVEDAKVVRRVFGRDGTIKRHSKAMTEPYSNLVFDHLYINEDLFPSIKPGQSVTLDEIIGSIHDGEGRND